jgi:single-strand DNA-binding protein
MTNLNKAMLIGRLGQDPETRYTKSGAAVCSFTLATNDYWKDKQGNRQERTEWHNIVTWSGLAEFAQNYLKKGRLIYVEGRLQTRDWTDNQNVRHFKTEIVANTVQLLDRQSDDQRAAEAPPRARQQPQARSGGRPLREEPEPYAPSGPAEEEPYLEDDIPF